MICVTAFSKTRFATAAAVGVLLFCNGCGVTKALWEKDRFGAMRFPATPLNLAVFMERGRPLVAYDEKTEDAARVTRRAFWIDPDATPPANPYRPKFVPLTTTNALSSVSITASPSTNGWSVVTSNGARDFSLYESGDVKLRCDLPQYGDPKGKVAQVLLTPFAIVTDATLGTIWFVLRATFGGQK